MKCIIRDNGILISATVKESETVQATLAINELPVEPEYEGVIVAGYNPTELCLTLDNDTENQIKGSDPMSCLVELAENGFVVHACGICVDFCMTSMAAQMSGGSRGYCCLDTEADMIGIGTTPVVNVFDICDRFIPKKDMAVLHCDDIFP